MPNCDKKKNMKLFPHLTWKLCVSQGAYTHTNTAVCVCVFQGLKKPYNPILGETFRCCWLHPQTDSCTFYIAEQVKPNSLLERVNEQDTLRPLCEIFLHNSAKHTERAPVNCSKCKMTCQRVPNTSFSLSLSLSLSLAFLCQVSHHPPISAFYVCNRKDGYSISGSILAKSKFYGTQHTTICNLIVIAEWST